ncbi:MAG: AbrB/MazE/SpoVT family DNA-binding domain-containing protein [Bacteriovoracales bacterium]|nr:AbrB/MazE/SpoVT family DNA-binding domain-containing protein [Bacteriovoracales bacterium]
MATKLQKWGNSIGVRIPKAIIQQAHLSVDTPVTIEHREGKIIIFPSKKGPRLNDLLDQITEDNLHTTDDFPPHGREAW